MRFTDFLKTTVLISAAAASALAAVTWPAPNGTGDDLVVPVGGRLVDGRGRDRVGHRAGGPRPRRRSRRCWRARETQPTLPELNPGRTVLNRLWPLLLSTVGAGAVAFVLPQVPAVATGFAIIWALAWRRQASAVTAIEERDGARFYIERTSPLQADQAGAHAGLPLEPVRAQRGSGRRARRGA